jgi:hypothetical protein
MGYWWKLLKSCQKSRSATGGTDHFRGGWNEGDDLYGVAGGYLSTLVRGWTTSPETSFG